MNQSKIRYWIENKSWCVISPAAIMRAHSTTTKKFGKVCARPTSPSPKCDDWREIMGVVGDVHDNGWKSKPAPPSTGPRCWQNSIAARFVPENASTFTNHSRVVRNNGFQRVAALVKHRGKPRVQLTSHRKKAGLDGW